MSKARSPRDVCSTTMGTRTEFCMIFSYRYLEDSRLTRTPPNYLHNTSSRRIYRSQKTAHPIGQEKRRAIVFGEASIAAVDDEGIAVPLHHGTLVGRQQRAGLSFARAVDGFVHDDILAAGIGDLPGAEIQRHALQRPEGAIQI